MYRDQIKFGENLFSADVRCSRLGDFDTYRGHELSKYLCKVNGALCVAYSANLGIDNDRVSKCNLSKLTDAEVEMIRKERLGKKNSIEIGLLEV